MLKTVSSAGGGGSGTVTNIATGTGLTGGPITTTGTISLANTAVTAATYGTAAIVSQITVNAQGQITSAANVAIAVTNANHTVQIVDNDSLPSLTMSPIFICTRSQPRSLLSIARSNSARSRKRRR